MYEFTHEFEKKEKKLKLYILLFIISSLIYVSIDFIGFWVGKTSGFRFIVNLLFNGIVLYFGWRRKLWAVRLVKLLVWLYFLLLLLIIIVTILRL